VGLPPRFICTRRRPPTIPLHRGRITAPPPFVGPVAPGIWRPGWIAARRRPPLVPRVQGQRFDPPWPFIPPPEFVPGYGAVTPTSQAIATTTLTGHDTGTVLLTDQATGAIQPAGHDMGTARPTGQAQGKVTPT